MEDQANEALTGAIEVPAQSATTNQLGGLHGVVAEYLTQAIATGRAPPALVNAAIAFLKNNNITASIQKNEALQALQSQLAAKRKGGQLTRKGMEEAVEMFGDMAGAEGMHYQ